MAARKLQQEVDKCFKKVSEGVAEFESIYEKIEQSTNAAQKEKLEDNLKREIKKLQRLRDQIKTWAASNDIKDKGPLLDHRKLIETQMEKFKAVEKAMKTKAYSKEGLSAAAKLDPKERAKLEACDFLSGTVEELERQIETLEAEGESIQATMKKGKNQSSKADRMAEIERITERHKWHQGKLELIKRSLENGAVETDQVTDLEESIKYYVTDGMNEDFMEDDEMYDELNLQEEEDVYGMNNDNDRVSSQDTQSIQEEPESHTKTDHIPSSKQKPSAPEPPLAAARRPSTQLRSPLPALATLHSPLSNLTNGSASGNMKPATLPTRPPGETLKYASAAAAAANAVGIAPLPPPPGATPPSTSNTPLASLPASHVARESPIAAPSQPASAAHTPAQRPSIPVTTLAHEARSVSRQSKSPAPSSQATGSIPPTPAVNKVESAKSGRASRASADKGALADVSEASLPNGPGNVLGAGLLEQDESIFHLPSDLQDLIQSFKVTQKRATITPSQSSLRMLAASNASFPDGLDAEQPRYYKPKYRFNTPSYYPQEPLPIFDDPRLYSRIDPDTLFYVFYYKQGTYQQFLAAKSLKDQSWRFHKQYQTWFQRHEEPKTITEEFEQGTYRFFDYESTWMNRRKADFKFAYKFLEDDV
ncbi:hypothetical protein V493_02260 [Pseudogymnoascus sp. VKM F-4281 (FW-2241)]|nr:hypothetical protein V493_02260 [Pseudogymnoascus sp. VKM F-4281 (FW-2241)]